MSFYQFATMKAPSIACWALAAIFGYGAVISSYWFAVLSIILLFLGVYYYNKENQKREEKERRDKEEQQRAQNDKAVLGFLGKVGKEIWDNIK